MKTYLSTTKEEFNKFCKIQDFKCERSGMLENVNFPISFEVGKNNIIRKVEKTK